MRALLCFISVILAFVSSLKCPTDYEAVEDRCVRTFLLAEYDSLQSLTPVGHRTCGADGATMPIIRNDQDKQFFVNYGTSLGANFLVLDLTCNQTSRKWQWGDGSAIDYAPVAGPLGSDCVEWDLSLALEPKLNDFKNLWMANKYPFTVLCVKGEDEPAGHCPSSYELNDDNWCIRTYYFGSSKSLQSLLPNARSSCWSDGATLPIVRNDRENTIFNRFALANGLGANGYLALDLICNRNVMHLTWVDGSTVDYNYRGSADFKFDCAMKPMETDVALPFNDLWTLFRVDSKANLMVLCVKKATPILPDNESNGTMYT